MIIELIVTYYCLRACSASTYIWEAVAHVCCKLKPRLLLSNRCHVEYSATLVEFLANQVARVFIVLEGNLGSELTSVGEVHTVSRASSEPWTGYGYDRETIY